jgi:uncharacterized protein YecE (DUF72 family)
LGLEFRHRSWFTADVYAILRDHDVGLVVNDADAGATPFVLTAPMSYVRLRKTRYLPDELERTKNLLGALVDRGVEVFAFVKHEDNPDAPLVAEELAHAVAPVEPRMAW